MNTTPDWQPPPPSLNIQINSIETNPHQPHREDHLTTDASVISRRRVMSGSGGIFQDRNIAKYAAWHCRLLYRPKREVVPVVFSSRPKAAVEPIGNCI